MMKESISIIKNLFATYKDNDFVIKKLNDKIKNTLPIEAMTWKYESEKKVVPCLNVVRRFLFT